NFELSAVEAIMSLTNSPKAADKPPAPPVIINAAPKVSDEVAELKTIKQQFESDVKSTFVKINDSLQREAAIHKNVCNLLKELGAAIDQTEHDTAKLTELIYAAQQLKYSKADFQKLMPEHLRLSKLKMYKDILQSDADVSNFQQQHSEHYQDINNILQYAQPQLQRPQPTPQLLQYNNSSASGSPANNGLFFSSAGSGSSSAFTATAPVQTETNKRLKCVPEA
ncbi:MAG TPA: hypothetical protein VLG38_02585, partial [Gammaproteobacteria bacterium]|nr:hypothetical protein [Gammaproteobacteria bacterium]